MPRPCSICKHPDRDAIDRRLVNGDPLPEITALFRVSDDALTRHKAKHIPPALAKASEAAEVAQADTLLREVKALRAKAYSLLLQAEHAGDLRTALQGVREARGCLELLAKLEGKVSDAPVVNVLVNPEWHQTRAVIVQALAPYPDARIAVAAALSRLDARS
jgi:hypothetical protein